METNTPTEHFDVLIVGAGLSGIGAGYHLQQRMPGQDLRHPRGRDGIGGTWDLFRYPGMRSDSDMYTLGYSFRPWTEAKAIADGPAILNYVRETAAEQRHRPPDPLRPSRQAGVVVVGGARWTVEVERGGQGETPPEIVRFTCSFLFMCRGYYNYAGGYRPNSPARAISPAASCIRSTGRRTWTTPASGSW